MLSLAQATPEADRPADEPLGGTPYRVLHQLSSGAAGEVFVVEHRELGSEFVAKLLHKRLLSDPQIVDRVRVEAQALGKLYHPNIVSVFGYGLTQDHRPYLVTEYLRGQTLGARLKAGPLPPLEALVYTCQILWALAAAHSIGIVHRDIKPENLFLVERPEAPPQLKVLDFSIARVIEGLSPLAPLPLVLPTDTGAIVGTPRYISPEAALGQHVDHRADLYSTGIVLYQMLAGRCPFDHAKDNMARPQNGIAQQPDTSVSMPTPKEPAPAIASTLATPAVARVPKRNVAPPSASAAPTATVRGLWLPSENDYEVPIYFPKGDTKSGAVTKPSASATPSNKSTKKKDQLIFGADDVK